MSNLNATNIKELGRIDATLYDFVKLPEWTPAMGAMLVCGIMPIGQPNEIPVSNNISLRKSIELASRSDVDQAHKVLKDWLEWHEEEEGMTPDQALYHSQNAHQYLLWCHEYYENSGPYSRPTWLSYWEAWCGWGHKTSAPSPAPRAFVERAVALEHALILQFNERSSIDLFSPVRSDELTAYVKQICASISDKARSTIAPQITQALNLAGNPRNPSAVWAELCKLAKTGQCTALEYVSETELRIPHKEGGWKSYKQSALQLFLHRHKPKV